MFDVFPVSYTHLDVYKRQVTDSTKKNLEMRVDAENGATAGKFDLAKMCIRDSLHPM